MSKKYRLYQVDSFTKNRFKGNPAGVISNADGLSEEMMQKIARELNNSETAFILSPASSDHDLYIRYYTPTKEVPICGHATIAAHYVRAKENDLLPTRVMQKSGVGILPVDITKYEENYHITMTQGTIEFGDFIQSNDKIELLNALGLKEEDLQKNCPIQIVSTSHSKVMIGIKENEKLHSLTPDYNTLTRLSKKINCNGYYVFTINVSEDELIKGRMFAPAVGINEDPVTGNANGPLGAYLIHYNLVKYDNTTFQFKAKQGESMGREGIIEVTIEINNDEPVAVKITGDAVIVFQSELEI